MTQSNELSEILKNYQNRSWANIMTGDSSWFLLTYSKDGAWLLPDNDPPEIDVSKFDCHKYMVAIIWRIKGFCIIDFFPESQSLNI